MMSDLLLCAVWDKNRNIMQKQTVAMPYYQMSNVMSSVRFVMASTHDIFDMSLAYGCINGKRAPLPTHVGLFRDVM